MEPNVYTAGCYIDCSHTTADELNYRIIKFAVDVFEWDGETTDVVRLMSDYLTDLDLSRGHGDWVWDEELSESLYFAADHAVEWLNSEIVSGTCYWNVEDNSLYLMEDTDGDV